MLTNYIKLLSFSVQSRQNKHDVWYNSLRFGLK